MGEEKSAARLDTGDWIIIGFIFAFAVTGAVYCFKHPSDIGFPAWVGSLTTSGGIFHWLRVKDQKQTDAS